MSAQRPGDTIPHQQETEAVIDALLAESGGGGGFLPDYANAVVRENPSPSTFTSGFFNLPYTPESAGWSLILVKFRLSITVAADNAYLGIENEDGFVYDRFSILGPTDLNSGYLHALVPPGADYILSGGVILATPDTGFARVSEITEVPALA